MIVRTSDQQLTKQVSQLSDTKICNCGCLFILCLLFIMCIIYYVYLIGCSNLYLPIYYFRSQNYLQLWIF